MAKKKQAKAKKVADSHDAGHEIEKFRQENLDLKEDINSLEEAVRRYERVYGSVPAIDAGVVESQAHGYAQMTAAHQPIIVEEVAAVIPLLKDAHGGVLGAGTLQDTMPELIRTAVGVVRQIREAIAEESGELGYEAASNDPDAGEEIGDEVD